MDNKFNRIVYEFNLGSAVVQEKPSMNEANGFKSGKEFINIKLRNYPKAVAKVNQLISDVHKRETIGMEARNFITSNHSWEAQAQRLSSICLALKPRSLSRKLPEPVMN